MTAAILLSLLLDRTAQTLNPKPLNPKPTPYSGVAGVVSSYKACSHQ